jgi:beta-galactosidase/beta-glucuronidase
MIWDEYPDWNMEISATNCLPEFLRCWQEEIRRDYSRPSIIGWCCMNETWDWHSRRQCDGVLESVYYMVKSLDNTRPVIDTSGNYHVVTDTYDIHWYEQNVENFKKTFEENPYFDNHTYRQTYNGTPYWVSEYGGIRLTDGTDGWGYGNAATSKEEFIERYSGLTKVLQDNPKCWALCYTQLYDVEQEQNGLYLYDRSDRFTEDEKKKLCEIMSRKAAVEE